MRSITTLIINEKKVIKMEYKYDVTKMLELAEDGENWRFYNDEQRFAISNLGRVYDLKLDKLVKLYLSGSGYYVCYLCDYVEGVKQLPVPVHRLVAETWVKNPHPDKCNVVNHIDEDKTNNRADNLEWCTQQYNVTYGTAQQRKKETQSKTLEYKKKYSDVSDLLVKKELEIAELQREKQILSEQIAIYRNTIAEMRILFETINYH